MKSVLVTTVLFLLALGFVADGLRQWTRPVPRGEPVLRGEPVPATIDNRPELARVIRIPALYKQTLASRQARWLGQLDGKARVEGIDDGLVWESLHPVEPSRNTQRLEPDDY